MKIEIFDLCVYFIFVALFKMYFIPEVIRQISKIVILFGIFFFIIKRLNKKELFNYSLIFSGSIILSGMYNYISGNYTVKALLDSFLYALSFYDIYILFVYAKKFQYIERMKQSLYRINLLYCILTVVSVAIVGTDNNSNVSAYLFGNKFTSSYLFISLISLYGMSHDMTLKKNRRRMCELIGVGTLFSLYVGCATASVSLILAAAIYYVDKLSHTHIFSQKVVIIGILIVTGTIPIVIGTVLKNKLINYIIFDVFHRSITVYGRFEIYRKYLFGFLKEKFWLGYGYSNGKMLQVTGVFGNAQNGLLEQMMNFGILGVLAILSTMSHALKRNSNTSCMLILLYAMIIAAIFEVTINWFFWIALFSIQWLEVGRKANEKSRDIINAAS